MAAIYSGDTVQRAGWLRRWASEQARVFFFSLGKLVQQPGATLLTALVIGMTLALPAILHLAVGNLQRLSYSWQSEAQFSLFLKSDIGEGRGYELADELRKRAGIGHVQYLSREQSAEEFRKLSGFGEALDLLDANPLPAVIIINPTPGLTPEDLQRVTQDLGVLPEVETAQFDQQWLERLHAVLSIAERGVLVLAALMIVAALVVVGNTLRLEIESRREEIIVMKLIGAPDRFVRRPFIYGGGWLGLLGGWLALVMLMGVLELVAQPGRDLARLYESSFVIEGPSWVVIAAILGGGLLLGIGGAWWTASKHLRAIEPV